MNHWDVSTLPLAVASIGGNFLKLVMWLLPLYYEGRIKHEMRLTGTFTVLVPSDIAVTGDA